MKPSVLAFRADVCGVSWYRMRMPLREMMEQELVELQSSCDLLPMQPIWNPRNPAEQKQKQICDQWYNGLAVKAEMLHSQRFANMEMFGLMKGLSLLHGLPWALEIDDDVINIDEANPAFDTYRQRSVDECYKMRPIEKPEEALPFEMPMYQEDGKLYAVSMKQQDRRQVSEQQIMQADALFTTTEDLAHLYGNMRRQAHPKDHIYVLPNSLTPEIWDSVQRPADHGDEVWVGWAGSTSHVRDIHLLVEIVEHLLEKHKNVKIFWTKLPQPQLLALTRKYPERCVMYDAWSSIEDWCEYYVSMNFDIALGPLVDIAFNRGKSNLKFLEAGICNQAFVGSDVGPYRNTIRNKKDGFICSRPKQWLKAIDALVESQELRAQIGGAARERVLTDFNMQKNCHLWVDAYKDVIEKLGPMARERTEEIRSAIPSSVEPDPALCT